MKSDDLKLTEIYEIHKLFKNKGWKIDDKNQCSLYKRFLMTYSNLTNEERELFLDLSNEFIDVSLDKYITILCDIMVNMQSCQEYDYTSIRDIYVMPLIPKKDDRKIKSSTFVSYLFSSKELYYYDCLAQKNFHLIDNYDRLYCKQKNVNKQDKLLLLVDDFVGSGNQALEAIKDVLNIGIEIKNIAIIALFIHNIGKQKINQQGIPLFYGEIIKKGISEHESLAKKAKVMQDIEEKINIDKRNSFGYMQSEALISLVRTPNNTFPLFWYKGNGRGKNYSPFPRMSK